MAGLFTDGIALPHIVASATTADLVDRFVRPTLAGEPIGSLGGHRARRRLRRRRHPHHRGARRRPLRRQRAKTFITSGVRADFVTTAVRTGGPGHGGVSLLVVEDGTPGFTVDPVADEDGLALLRHRRAVLRRRAGPGREPGRRPRTPASTRSPSSSWSSGSRSPCTPTASPPASLALTAAYCRDRETFGKPLIANQVVRHKLVEMRRQVEVARAYTREVARRHVAGRERHRRGLPGQADRRATPRRTSATRPCSCTAAPATCTAPRWSGTTATPGSCPSAAAPPRCSTDLAGRAAGLRSRGEK